MESGAAMAVQGQAAGPSVPPLVADGVRKVYDDGWHQVPVIADLSFTLEAGTIVSIVGPSGCGKTTLLNVLSGLIAPSAGSISWYGRPLQGMPPQVGYMLQKDMLLPWRSVLDNVTLAPRRIRHTPRAQEHRARHIERPCQAGGCDQGDGVPRAEHARAGVGRHAGQSHP